jgi:uncharacterized protein (DUF302 family)
MTADKRGESRISIEVERFSIVSSRPFEEIIATINAGIAQPDLAKLFPAVHQSNSVAQMESIIHEAIGAAGLMRFAQFDLGEVVRMGTNRDKPRIVRFLIGNPLIMKEMVKHVPDAGSYAPVTVLVDERADGVHLSYDRMVSFLVPYENAAALDVAIELDAKIENLLQQAAGPGLLRAGED